MMYDWFRSHFLSFPPENAPWIGELPFDYSYGPGGSTKSAVVSEVGSFTIFHASIRIVTRNMPTVHIILRLEDPVEEPRCVNMPSIDG